MFTKLPAHLELRGNTPRFTADTLPEALQKWHRTKEAVWAKIVLTSGSALYEILTEPPETIQLVLGIDGIIEPQQPHRVTPTADVELQIFFYHMPEVKGAGSSVVASQPPLDNISNPSSSLI